jgi:hypothetical protein
MNHYQHHCPTALAAEHTTTFMTALDALWMNHNFLSSLLLWSSRQVEMVPSVVLASASWEPKGLGNGATPRNQLKTV